MADAVLQEAASPEDRRVSVRFADAMRSAWEISAKNGNVKMTLDEINAEIAAARRERRERANANRGS